MGWIQNMKNDSNVILDKLYKTLKYSDLLNSSLKETATMVEDHHR